MSAPAQPAARFFTAREKARWSAMVLGFGSLLLAIAAIQVLIDQGYINRFIVPTPLQIAGAFGLATALD